MTTPKQMADLYFNRMHFAAVPEVKAIMTEYRESPATYAYWSDVLSHLNAKIKKKKEGGNPYVGH